MSGGETKTEIDRKVGPAREREMMVSVAGRFFGNAYFYPSYKGKAPLNLGGVGWGCY